MGADVAKRDVPRKKADGVGGMASADSKSPNSKVILGAFIVPPLVVALAVAVVVGLNRDDGNSVVEAEDTTMSTSSTPTIESIDYDSAETSAGLYCEFAPTGYEGDWEDIYDTYIQLVPDGIQTDEDIFRSEAVSGESGEIDDEAIEAVLDDPEGFLKNHGYTAITSTTAIAESSTYTPNPTYQEPEPTYEEPSNSGGNVDTGVGDGERQLAWRTVDPFGGLQGCEYSASQQPLYASECHVGSDNLYYYDSKVQAG